MPRVFVSPITRVGHLRPPTNAGEIQAGTQLIVFSRVKSADASHLKSSMRHVMPHWLIMPHWLRRSQRTILLQYCQYAVVGRGRSSGCIATQLQILNLGHRRRIFMRFPSCCFGGEPARSVDFRLMAPVVAVESLVHPRIL